MMAGVPGGGPKGAARAGVSVFALASALILVTLLFNVHCFRSSVKRVAVVAAPRKLSPTNESSSEPDAGWQAAARANLSHWQAGLMQAVAPHQGKPWPGRPGWDLLAWQPIVTCPPDRPQVLYGGTGDGAKHLCTIKKDEKSCVIYSLGSAGNFKFEEAMLEATNCDIFTFDCTFNGTSINPERHHYRKWCLGDPAASGQHRTWANITSTLGHEHVSLLKMDIEGHEYAVLAELQPQHALPEQIGLEIHVIGPPNMFGNPTGAPASASGLAVVFAHLANLGYAAHAMEVNEAGGPWCCSEFSFLRVRT